MDRDHKLALTAAALAMAAEVPISQKYDIVPPVSPVARFLVAGGMTYVSVLIASKILLAEDKL